MTAHVSREMQAACRKASSGRHELRKGIARNGGTPPRTLKNIRRNACCQNSTLDPQRGDSTTDRPVLRQTALTICCESRFTPRTETLPHSFKRILFNRISSDVCRGWPSHHAGDWPCKLLSTQEVARIAAVLRTFGFVMTASTIPNVPTERIATLMPAASA